MKNIFALLVIVAATAAISFTAGQYFPSSRECIAEVRDGVGNTHLVVGELSSI